MVAAMTEKSVIVQDQITIAVDADNCTALTLELAVDIAAAVKGQLQGLFIENADLLNSASLPFAREVLLTSGLPRDLNREIIEENYKRQATRFQKMLSLKARQSVLHCDFRSVAGRRRDVFTMHPNAGYIIFERRLHRPVWSHRPENKTRHILVVGPANGLRMKKALELLANKFTGNLIEVYSFSDTGQPWQSEPDQTNQKFIPLKDNAAVETLLHNHLDYILVSRSISASLLNSLILEGQCPIIVVD